MDYCFVDAVGGMLQQGAEMQGFQQLYQQGYQQDAVAAGGGEAALAVPCRYVGRSVAPPPAARIFSRAPNVTLAWGSPAANQAANQAADPSCRSELPIRLLQDA